MQIKKKNFGSNGALTTEISCKSIQRFRELKELLVGQGSVSPEQSFRLEQDIEIGSGEFEGFVLREGSEIHQNPKRPDSILIAKQSSPVRLTERYQTFTAKRGNKEREVLCVTQSFEGPRGWSVSQRFFEE